MVEENSTKKNFCCNTFSFNFYYIFLRVIILVVASLLNKNTINISNFKFSTKRSRKYSHIFKNGARSEISRARHEHYMGTKMSALRRSFDKWWSLSFLSRFGGCRAKNIYPPTDSPLLEIPSLIIITSVLQF